MSQRIIVPPIDVDITIVIPLPCSQQYDRVGQFFKEAFEVDLTLTVKQEAIRKMARQFAENELAPIAREIDAERRFPWEVIVVKGDIRSEIA